MESSPTHDDYDGILAIRTSHEGPNVALAYDDPILVARGLGTRLYDHCGQAWLDCVNNVAHVGHSNQAVVAAQVAQLQAVNTNSRYLGAAHASYTRALVDTMPDNLSVCYFCNSGSEANDLALQLARAARPGRRVVAVMEGAYHGHTSTMMSCSPYKFWGPGGAGRPDWVHVLPIPDTYRGRNLNGAAAATAVVQAAEADGTQIAAFFCESALSCGGQVIVPPGYLQDVYSVMHAHGVICVADEVQTGLGRLGQSMWAFQPQGVEPDIVVGGKALGNGYPLAAVVTTHEIAAAFAKGPSYFNTFGGGSAACASGLAVLRQVQALGLQDHAANVGALLLEGLRGLQAEWPGVVGDVRGQGLFIGIEVVRNSAGTEPSPGKAKLLKEYMKTERVLLSTDGPYDCVIKIKPPMLFSEADSRLLMDAMRRVLPQVEAADWQSLDSRLMGAISPGQMAAQQYFARTCDQ